MTLQYSARLPRNVPVKARVYALAAPRASARPLQSLAEALGLRDAEAELTTSASAVGLRAGRWSIAMHKTSGALRALHVDRYAQADAPVFEVSDRQAQRAADKFVARLDLLPKGQAKVMAVTHLRQAGADPKGGERIDERVLDAGVVYGRVIDELPVIGPGGMALVHVAGDGQVVGARRIWRTLGRGVATVKLRPAEWAKEDFEASVKRVMGDVEVVKAQLGYLEFGELDRQTLIEPVYAFVYVVRHGEVASKHVHVVHAGEKAQGKLMGARRFVAAKQRARKGD